MPRSSPALIPVIVFALAIAACKGPQAPQKGAAVPLTPLVLAAEDLITIRSSALSSGPAITGSIQPERKADVRAEVSATVLRVMKENGEQVRRGDVLVKLDDTSIRDALASAEASSRAAGQSLEQSQRQFDRMKTLRTQGMVSLQGLEDAEVKRNNQQSYRTRNIKITEEGLRIPKIKTYININLHRPIQGTIKSSTLTKTPSGKYYISILCVSDVALNRWTCFLTGCIVRQEV